MFRRLLLAASFLVVCASLPAQAAETQPGDSCAGQTDLIRTVGGPENPGTGYFLVCDGTVWKAVNTWDSASGKSLFQVNTDAGSCTATKLGRLRYDGSSTWEYCNGTSWTALPGSATAAGSTGYVQFKSSTGSLGSSASLFWDDTNGRLGIATASPGARLAVAGDIRIDPGNGAIAVFDMMSGSQARYRISKGPGSPVNLILGYHASNSTPVGKFAFDGANARFGIGTLTPGVALDVVGDIQFTGTIADVSDRRLKSDIAPLPPQLVKIERLAPVSFTMKADPARRTELGLIAQDVEAIYPDLVSTNPNGTKAMNYQGLIAPMIAAMKEQQRQIQALQARLDAIEQQAASPAPAPPQPAYNQ